ncbi:MAG: family 78 glycoside hydrolase catalytic domain [Lachnospiraceae bacterium]|nr:family 78 glycoside hydrolase catalytic domain [Lachnospiraceae bacterium]
MKILQCRTNHMTNPIGFAMDYPVVSWIADSDESACQERAQIIVALDNQMKEIIYQSDPAANPDSTGVKLPIILKPCTEYYWTVQVWGDQGDTAVSQVNYFETGKREEPLGGQWITTPWEDKTISPYIRKSFRTEKEICKARLYVTGLGLVWPEMNGQRIGREYFAPGFTAVDRWVQIYTYDVTELMRQGDNVLGFMLGNGWAKGRFGGSRRTHTKTYINDYFLRAELRIQLADGSEQVIVTDDSWRCTPSPVLFDNFYDGEIYDERKVIPGWSAPEVSDDGWDYMVPANKVPLGGLEDRLSLPVIIKETIRPVEVIRTPAGEAVLDMGQNMVGWIRMRVHELSGTRIKLSHGEILQDGCFYRENLRTAKAEYIYISDGTEKAVEPHFTFYGFRYVKVEGVSGELNLEDFTGCVVYSDLDETGWVETSDQRINRLFENAKWSQKDNFLELPTDCPQRDERMGWTGDAQVFCKTASYNMETYAFYTKYLHDLWHEQQKNHGMVTHVVPSLLRESFTESAFWHGGASVWGDAAVIIPWTMYRHYGDITILERQYPSMSVWVDWIVGKYVDEKGLWSGGFQFGDWLALDGQGEDDRYGGTDTTYIASVFLKNSSLLVAQTAKLLGKEEDADRYQQISDRTRAAIRKEYFTEDGRMTIPTQTAHILALQFDLVEPEGRKLIAEGLIKLLEANNMHLSCGFVGTSYLCRVLSAEGCSEAAYKVLFQKDFPSWLYEVDMGATTIWERWNSVLPDGKISGTGMNSLNHYAYGSIVQWYYENMCGLTEKEPGFKEFYVRPEFTERFDHVEMEYHSPRGEIRIRWEKAKTKGREGYRLAVKVPFNTTAYVSLPGDSGKLCRLESGLHEIWC